MPRLSRSARLATFSAVSALALSTPTIAAEPLRDTGSAVDEAVRPGDDFYRYANGPWLNATPLPKGRSRIDTSAILREETGRRVKALIETSVQAPNSARERRVGDYYAAWLDRAGIEARGLKPVAGDLAAIAALRDRRALSAWLGQHLALDDGSNTNTDGLLGVWIHQGFHDPDHYIPHLVQGGLGLEVLSLGDRASYLDATPEATQLRDRYRAHVATMFRLTGFDEASIRAGRVLDLEIAIARSHATRADTDDVFKTDNMWSRADFDRLAPGMDWSAWMTAAGLERQARFVVWQPSAVKGAAALVAAQPLEAWRDYLSFHLISRRAAILPAALAAEAAAFRGDGPPDVQAAAMTATTAAMGQDIGQLYVERFFPPSAKAAAATMAENLHSALLARVSAQSWRSTSGQQIALEKVRAVRIGVGYPDRWIDYGALKVRRDDAYGNLQRAETFAYRRELAKLDQPVDPGEWIQLLPQQVGAIINFSPNAMLFSAGLLQPPTSIQRAMRPATTVPPAPAWLTNLLTASTNWAACTMRAAGWVAGGRLRMKLDIAPPRPRCWPN